MDDKAKIVLLETTFRDRALEWYCYSGFVSSIHVFYSFIIPPLFFNFQLSSSPFFLTDIVTTFYDNDHFSSSLLAVSLY